MTQDQIIAYLIAETAIQANQTSQNLYKLKSRSDPRASSLVIGMVGTGILGGILGFVILTDMPTLVRHIAAALTNRHKLLYRNNKKK